MNSTLREIYIQQISATSGSPTELSRLIGVSKQRADQLLHPEKHQARIKARKANPKPDRCQVCHQAGDLEAHHYDYNLPHSSVFL